MNESQKRLRKMLLTASLVTMGIVLDVIISAIPGLNVSMPFGGKFFGISMLPLILIGLICGLSYGLIGGFIYALFNFSADYIVTLAALNDLIATFTDYGFTFGQWMMIILFDYMIPFASFGLSGLFSRSFNRLSTVFKAIILTSTVRLLSSTLSGVLIWGDSIEWLKANPSEANQMILGNFIVDMYDFFGGSVWLYSFSYNILYILSSSLIVALIFWKTHQRIYLKSQEFIFQSTTDQ